MSVISAINKNQQGQNLEVLLPANTKSKFEALKHGEEIPKLPLPLKSEEEKLIFLANKERKRLENLGFQGRIFERTIGEAFCLSCNFIEILSLAGASAIGTILGGLTGKYTFLEKSVDKIRETANKISPNGSILNENNDLISAEGYKFYLALAKQGLIVATFPSSLCLNFLMGTISTCVEEIDYRSSSKNYVEYLKKIEENPSYLRDGLNCLAFLGLTALTAGRYKPTNQIAIKSARFLSHLSSSLGMSFTGALGEQLMRVEDEKRGGFKARVILSDTVQGALSSSIFGYGMSLSKLNSVKNIFDLSDGLSDLIETGSEFERIENNKEQTSLMAKNLRRSGYALKIFTAAYDTADLSFANKFSNQSKITKSEDLLQKVDPTPQVLDEQIKKEILKHLSDGKDLIIEVGCGHNAGCATHLAFSNPNSVIIGVDPSFKKIETSTRPDNLFVFDIEFEELVNRFSDLKGKAKELLIYYPAPPFSFSGFFGDSSMQEWYLASDDFIGKLKEVVREDGEVKIFSEMTARNLAGGYHSIQEACRKHLLEFAKKLHMHNLSTDWQEVFLSEQNPQRNEVVFLEGLFASGYLKEIKKSVSKTQDLVSRDPELAQSEATQSRLRQQDILDSVLLISCKKNAEKQLPEQSQIELLKAKTAIYKHIVLSIGCGDAELEIAQAKEAKNTLFIGIDPKLNPRKATEVNSDLDNIFLIEETAEMLISPFYSFFAAKVRSIDIVFPQLPRDQNWYLLKALESALSLSNKEVSVNLITELSPQLLEGMLKQEGPFAAYYQEGMSQVRQILERFGFEIKINKVDDRFLKQNFIGRYLHLSEVYKLLSDRIKCQSAINEIGLFSLDPKLVQEHSFYYNNAFQNIITLTAERGERSSLQNQNNP